MKMFNEENEKLKNEVDRKVIQMSKIREFNSKFLSDNNNLTDEATKILLKEKQSLDLFISRFNLLKSE